MGSKREDKFPTDTVAKSTATNVHSIAILENQCAGQVMQVSGMMTTYHLSFNPSSSSGCSMTPGRALQNPMAELLTHPVFCPGRGECSASKYINMATDVLSSSTLKYDVK